MDRGRSTPFGVPAGGVVGKDQLAREILVVGQQVHRHQPRCASTNSVSFKGSTLRFSPVKSAGGTSASAWSTW